MKSNPITQRAATKYGSAPKNQEVTVDAGGRTPARFERMSPVKQTTTTRTGQVRDDQDNLMEAVETTTTQPDIINQTIESGGTGLSTGGANVRQAGENETPGGSSNQAWIDTMQRYLDEGATIQDLVDKDHGTMSGLKGLGLIEGRGQKPTDFMSTTTTTKGSESKQYEYKPVERDTQTFQIRDARRRDRNIKRARRVMNRDLTRYGEDSAEYKSSKAAYKRFLDEREKGINPKYTQDYKEKVKAGKDVQTKAEFEGGGTNNNTSSENGTSNLGGRFSNMSLGQIQNKINNTGGKPSLFTPGSSGLNIGNYQTDRTNKLSQFSFGDSNKGSAAQKRGNVGGGYKMGGFGSKNKNK